MVECVFMEVTVTFEAPNTGHMRREVGWPLASLETVSRDRIIDCAGEIQSGPSQERKACFNDLVFQMNLLTRLSSMLVFLWCLVT